MGFKFTLYASFVKTKFYMFIGISTVDIHRKLHHLLRKAQQIIDLIFLFFELHMPKIVLFFAMLLCVYDKCALYIIIVILISISFVFGRPIHTFSIYISSVLVSILLLARMIYQIQYIEHDRWNVVCVSILIFLYFIKLNCAILKEFPNNTKPNETLAYSNGSQLVNYTYNNAEWLGFHKTDKDHSLPALVKWNIIYIVVVTLWAVVLVRQFNFRVSKGKPTTRPYFMFPKIKRSDADKNLKNCLKYLFNFAFYKFGIEVSFKW